MRTLRVAASTAALAACAAVSSAPAAFAADQVWWVNYGTSKVSRVATSGGSVTDVFTGANGVNGPYGLAMDPARERVFWANYTASNIGSGNISGSAAQTVLSGVSNPFGLAVDPEGGKLYWANGSGNEIRQVNTNGLSASVFFTDTGALFNPVVDPIGGRVYWVTNARGPLQIGYKPIAGGAAGSISLAGCTDFFASQTLTSIAVDAVNGFIYGGTSGHPTIIPSDIGIVRMRLDGSGCEPVVAATDTPFGLALDPDAKRLYWGDYFGNAVRYVDLDPLGTQQTLTTNASSPAFPQIVKRPAGTVAVSPANAQVGDTLTCTSEWSPGLVGAGMYRSPATAEYSWTRDGSPVSAAGGATLRADQAGDYACSSTGTNAAGSTTVTSLAVPVTVAPSPGPSPEPGPQPTPSNEFEIRSARVVGNSIRTRLDLPGVGTLVQEGTRRTRTASAARVCRARVPVTAAGTFTVTCAINRSTQLVRRKASVRVKLRTTFAPQGGTPRSIQQTVVLRARTPRFAG